MIKPDLVFTVRYFGRVLYVSHKAGLTPFYGHTGGLPCKQGRSAKGICTINIEQVPRAPKASIENRYLFWQAKADTDRRSMLSGGSDTNSLAGIHVISAHMGLRPHVLMQMVLALSVARPPCESLHSRGRERITQLGRILSTGVDNERNAVRRPLYA